MVFMICFLIFAYFLPLNFLRKFSQPTSAKYPQMSPPKKNPTTGMGTRIYPTIPPTIEALAT